MSSHPWSTLDMNITCLEKLLDNQKQLLINSQKLSDAYDNQNNTEYQRLFKISEKLKKEYHEMYTKCERNMKP